jgi:hypothetical protein
VVEVEPAGDQRGEVDLTGIGSGISSAPMPTSTTVPAPRTAVMPAFTAGVAPEQSMKASTPRSATDSVTGSRLLVAPNRSAIARRSGTGSETMTSAAPNALAAWVAMTPIGPAPATSTREPGLIWALRLAQMPTESGSSSAATSSVTASGTGCANGAWIVTYSWRAPSMGGVA